jgi:hypothetical protein
MIRAGGALHFGILCAAAVVPAVLDWESSLSGLNDFLRNLMWVYGAFIFMVILAFGTGSLLHARQLVSGTPLARFFCGFVAVFWLARLLVQFFVFGNPPFIEGWFLTAGYHGLALVFLYLAVVYSIAAIFPQGENEICKMKNEK